MHDCDVGISPVASYSGVKEGVGRMVPLHEWYHCTKAEATSLCSALSCCSLVEALGGGYSALLLEVLRARNNGVEATVCVVCID